MEQNKKVLIIDASAVINNFTTKFTNYRLIATSRVVKELKSRAEVQDLEERLPKKELVKIVNDINKDLSDKISEADKDLLALALEFRAPVATDDYGIQNIAKQLKIEFIPVAEEGIKKVIQWQYYCPGCRKKYAKGGTCDSCGSKIKRKPKISDK